MDGLELLIAIAAFIIAIVALQKASKLEKAVALLRRQLTNGPAKSEALAAVPSEPAAEAAVPPVEEAPAPIITEPARGDNWGSPAKVSSPVPTPQPKPHR